MEGNCNLQIFFITCLFLLISLYFMANWWVAVMTSWDTSENYWFVFYINLSNTNFFNFSFSILVCPNYLNILSFFFWSCRLMKMVKSLACVVSAQMKNVVAVFSWLPTLTDTIVANVIWHTSLTNQKKECKKDANNQ